MLTPAPSRPKSWSSTVGGTHIKAVATGHKTKIRFDSGPTMTPAKMVKQLKAATEGWNYDAVSIGYPGPVVDGKLPPIR